MIDLIDETVISLSQAAKHPALPRRRAGKRPHVSTLYRWAASGCAGIKLETIRFGGTLCTSLEAIQRFAERLTVNEADVDPSVAAAAISDRHRIARAERELRQAGFDR